MGASGRMDTLSRRGFLQGGIAAAVASASQVGAKAAPARRLPYGAAVALPDLRSDPRLAEAIAANCNLVVPVSELKWSDLRPTRQQFAFEGADAIAEFAKANGLVMRGHTLVWYAALPDWTKDIDSEAAAEGELRRHIETVVARYRGQIRSWDVVNEVIPDVVRSDRDRRPSLWSRWLGDRYIPLAYRIAAEVDPQAQLVLNEYDVEFATDESRAKRGALRDLAVRLKDGGAPLHAIGLQCHLRGGLPIDRDGLTRFVADMRDIGLKCLVTELDVIDQKLPADEDQRDRLIASQVREVLTAVTAPGPLDALVTWGLSDRYSWIQYAAPRPDHRPNRPLPLDWEFRRKPFMNVVEDFVGREH